MSRRSSSTATTAERHSFDALAAFIDAIASERQAWDALQRGADPREQADQQGLYGAWVQAVNRANSEAQRFFEASRSRQGAGAALQGRQLQCEAQGVARVYT
ncbi:MAG: hypothetical protein NDJ19_08830 [Ramlibacter sp.]|nr:hypothetical protein [Ramlibacter sp.]